MLVKELFIFSHYRIVVFAARNQNMHYGVSGCNLVKGLSPKNLSMISTEFEKAHVDIYDHKVLGRLSELTAEKCEVIFREARIDVPDRYPNFQTSEEKLPDALSSLKSFLTHVGGWNEEESLTWIIIPKPTKKLTGKKIEFEFMLPDAEFHYINQKTIISVYQSTITKESKEINYSIEIPDYLYDFLVAHPEKDKRPKSKVFTTNVFSALRGYVEQLCFDACNLAGFDREMKNAKKVLVVDFGSSQQNVHDNYQGGYAGKETKTKFQFFVGYSQKSYSLVSRNSDDIFVDKKYESGKGFVPVTGRMLRLGQQGGKAIEWTQEREDFLVAIETKFKTLSDNLNHYLSDMNDEKLDHLISSKGMNLLGQ